MRVRRLRRASVVLVLALLAGCMPLYIPPVPEPIEAPDPVTVGSDSTLEVRNETLVATLHVRGATESGWLTLQWYDPRLREVASESVWLDADAPPARLTIAVPDHVERVEGRWRLVIGFRGSVVRQLDAVFGAAAADLVAD